MQIYIICCIYVYNLCLVKILPLKYAKMLSVDQIAVFINEQNLQNKSMKNFLHVDTNSNNLDFDR